MTQAQRKNARFDKIWDEANRLERQRLVNGEQPNPNLSGDLSGDGMNTTHFTAIEHVGHSDFWHDAAGTSDPLGVLRYMLRTYALDPRFTELGDGRYAYYEPAVDGRGDQIHPDHPGVLHFWGNFFAASCVFSIDTNDPGLIAELQAIIAANMASDAFTAAQKELAEGKRYENERRMNKEREVSRDHARKMEQYWASRATRP